MRFLVDAQLPEALCRWLVERGHDAAYVGAMLPGETPDREVAAYAAAGGYILISKDEDFVTRHPPVDYQLLWLRIGNASNRALAAWLEPRFAGVIEKLALGERLVEVR